MKKICMIRCGKQVEFEKISFKTYGECIGFWELQDKGVFCKECEKEKENIDKPVKQLNLVGE